MNLKFAAELCKKTYDDDLAVLLWQEPHENAWLAFRGTVNAHEWARDAEAFLVSDPPGRVHAGFRAATVEHWPRMDLPDELFITGHSLGGAIALLAARKLQFIGKKILGVVTFGCPRVGDSAFAASIDFQVERVVHAADIVPDMPRFPFLDPYVHVGTLIQLGDPRGMPNWEDHHIGNYMKCLE